MRDLFCADPPPRITSLYDVQREFGLFDAQGVGSPSYALVVLLGHSTALSGEVVSELNPRAIIATGYVIMAFSRGVQQLEIAATDRLAPDQRGNFYLLRFEQACNAAAGGCNHHDLYTRSVESDWLRVALDDDEDLKNTPSDCRQCHQRGLDRPILLMREQEGPWAHFFALDQDETPGIPEPSGTALLRDYLRAKGDEPYANLSRSILGSTVGAMLETFVDLQPLLFDSATIANELWPWRGGFAAKPERSATWDAAYEAFKRGEQLALPYFRTRVSQPEKAARLTEAYQRHLSGALAPEDFPDFADIFPDDPQTRAEIGLQTEPGAGPVDVLIQACAACHNDVLDQSISRANFSVALGRMSRAELDLAIHRLQLPLTAAGAMPPPGRRQIAPESLAPLIEYLRRAARPAADDAKLDRVAQYGMALPQSNARAKTLPTE